MEERQGDASAYKAALTTAASLQCCGAVAMAEQRLAPGARKPLLPATFAQRAGGAKHKQPCNIIVKLHASQQSCLPA
jgi:hypothetical protein